MLGMSCMCSMSMRQVPETVAIRFPKDVWRRVRLRALARGETGLSWLARCAEVCLRTAEGEAVTSQVTAGMVEPASGSDVDAETSRPAPASRASMKGAPVEPQAVMQTQVGATEVWLERQRAAQRAARTANARQWRGREGEDDQRPPGEWEE